MLGNNISENWRKGELTAITLTGLYCNKDESAEIKKATAFITHF